jgi:integrase/recombinase XerD
MHIEKALAAYLLQLQADGRAASTRDQVCRHVRLLSRWLQDGNGPTRVEKIGHEDLARFLASPVVLCRDDGGPRSAPSTNQLRSSIRTFFAYLDGAGYVDRNPARLIRRARCASPPPRALPPADCRRLLSTLAKRRDSRGQRDHALVALLLGAGLRISSAVALRVEDLDLDEGVGLLRKAKGDRPAEVFLAPGVVRTLRTYLGKRRDGPVFESAPGRCLDVRQARRRLAQAIEAADIERRVTPHTLRHSFATQLLARTGNVRLVQRALGHQSIASTAIYAVMGDDALRRALSG